MTRGLHKHRFRLMSETPRLIKGYSMTYMLLLTSCSYVDKAHLRLAAAKAVLRLSKHWDQKIPVDLFYLTLRTLEVEFLLNESYIRKHLDFAVLLSSI